MREVAVLMRVRTCQQPVALSQLRWVRCKEDQVGYEQLGSSRDTSHRIQIVLLRLLLMLLRWLLLLV
jgi:hypothetical protein